MPLYAFFFNGRIFHFKIICLFRIYFLISVLIVKFSVENG